METTGIVEAFSNMISSDKKGKVDTSKLASELSKATGKKISVSIAKDVSPESFFGMAVTPDHSTIEKISKAVINGETKVETMSAIWKKAGSWRIDIDSNLLSILNPRELTACVLHELGHITDSDSVVTRLQQVVQYSVSTSSIAQKAMLKNNFISKVLAIPITVACQFNYNPSQIRKELKADQMAVKCGYQSELTSSMMKIQSYMSQNRIPSNNISADIDLSMDYTKNTLDQLQKRQAALAKKGMLKLRNNLPTDTAIYECVEGCYNSFFESSDETLEKQKLLRIEEVAKEAVEGEYFLEFGFGKKLKPIETNQIDYIRIKMQDMKSINDKLMILSYTNSKLEICNYYLDILNNPKYAKKYKVPHSKEYLDYLKEELTNLRNAILNTPVDSGHERIHVNYPVGYDG